MTLKLSEDVQKFLKDEYPNVDIDNMSLEELKTFKEEIVQKRQEINLLELTQKRLGNAAYGASASPFFYFFNVDLAADITGECRVLTKTMWDKFEVWFHEDIWERKDIEIETSIEEGVLISADAELLSLVWNNLFSNAFKFTDNDGIPSFIAIEMALEREFTYNFCNIL